MIEDNAKSILDAGMMVGDVRTPNVTPTSGAPFVVRPQNAVVQSLEDLLMQPQRIREEVELHDPQSFVDYVNRFKESGTVIFFNQSRGKFRAVIDYHEPIYPRWCSHIVNYTVRQTPEWAAWVGINKHAMKQSDFAQFLESHMEDVAGDFGSTLLKIAYTLELKSEVSMVSHEIDPSNGSVRLSYEETVEGTASKGSIVIPRTFQLEIVPYVNGPKFQVTCRLCYRLVNRTAQFWIEMVQLEKLLEQALAKIRANIQESTDIKALAGE